MDCVPVRESLSPGYARRVTFCLRGSGGVDPYNTPMYTPAMVLTFTTSITSRVMMVDSGQQVSRWDSKMGCLLQCTPVQGRGLIKFTMRPSAGALKLETRSPPSPKPHLYKCWLDLQQFGGSLPIRATDRRAASHGPGASARSRRCNFSSRLGLLR